LPAATNTAAAMRQGPNLSPMNRLPMAAAKTGEMDYLLHVVTRSGSLWPLHPGRAFEDAGRQGFEIEPGAGGGEGLNGPALGAHGSGRSKRKRRLKIFR
jgi:hypothetical protein